MLEGNDSLDAIYRLQHEHIQRKTQTQAKTQLQARTHSCIRARTHTINIKVAALAYRHAELASMLISKLKVRLPVCTSGRHEMTAK